MPAAQRARLRIIFHLPVQDDAQELVVLWLIAYLNQRARLYVEARREFQEGRITTPPSGFEGFTRCATLPSPFTGYYWSSDDSRAYVEEVALFFVDYVGPQSPTDLVDELGGYITGLYTAVGTRQEELWIVAHPITQFEKQDRV